MTQNVNTNDLPRRPDAEQAVIGSMMTVSGIIGDITELINANDFYEPRHSTVFDTIVDLNNQGHPTELAAVVSKLQTDGELARVGGVEYVAGLYRAASVRNSMYYATIIKETSETRQLALLAQKAARDLLDGSGKNNTTVVGELTAGIDAVTQDNTDGGGLTAIGQLMDATFDGIDALKKTGGGVTGVPTGFTDLDRLTFGMHPGQMITVAARPGVGKALALDTLLPTPVGWTTMGEVCVGDKLIGRDGKPTTVVAATEVMIGRPCYEVTFSDGTVVWADAEHQWVTQTRLQRQGRAETRESVVSTRDIAKTLRVGGDNRLNYSVDLAGPFDAPDAELLVAPYTLGAWLGDGASAGNSFTSETEEIPERIRADGYVVDHKAGYRYGIMLEGDAPRHMVRSCLMCGVEFQPYNRTTQTCGRQCGGAWRSALLKDGLSAPKGILCSDCGKHYSGGGVTCQKCYLDNHTFRGHLRTVGVLGFKHIPTTYLRSSIRQRKELLAGLLDTDGWVTKTGSCALTLTSERLILDAFELIASLGYRPSITTKKVRGRTEESSTAYTIVFASEVSPFQMKRKSFAMNSVRAGRSLYATKRYITSVKPIQSVPVRCVEVDSVDHTYLVGRAFIPTHNSTLGLNIAQNAAIRHGIPSAFFTLEMSRGEVMQRLLSAECKIELGHIRSGKVSEDEWDRIGRKAAAITDAPLYIDDTANITMSQIKTRCRRMQQQHGLGLVVIDYLQLMTGDRKTDSRQQEVSEISRNVKLLAKELGIPVIAMSQLNRGSENRSDPRPKISDLRESGSIEQDSDTIWLIHREDMNDPDSPRAGEADLIIGKQRGGATGTIVLGFQGGYSRFVDMAQ